MFEAVLIAEEVEKFPWFFAHIPLAFQSKNLYSEKGFPAGEVPP